MKNIRRYVRGIIELCWGYAAPLVILAGLYGLKYMLILEINLFS